MNSEKPTKEKKKWWKYVLYFFYGWLFFFILICFFIVINGWSLISDLKEDWIIIFFITVFPAFISIPLIDLIVIENFWSKVRAYFKRFLFPIYLFPIKIITYSIYYLILALIRLFISLLKILWDFIRFPFINLKNFLKSLFIAFLIAYMLASLFVNVDYIKKNYGWYGKFFSCNVFGQFGVNDKIKESVVRVVGGKGEGSGFFIQPNQILTNFHVIAGEPSPKIIFPDGTFIVPERIIGNKDRDLAIIFTKQEDPDMVMTIMSSESVNFYENEAILATGYALGTDLIGSATQLRGNLIDTKKMSSFEQEFIRTDISLVGGMSGGPLTDLCGTVIGVNTMTVGGMSLFIPAFKDLIEFVDFTDNDIKKIEVDPSASPEEAVYSFYIYLKARRMEDGFNLLSKEYLKNTNFEEWSNRFNDVLDVDVIKSERYEKTEDTVSVKFSTKNWVGGEVVMRYYEGVWTMVEEDGVYKIQKGKILEVDNPEIYWFYQ